jgi:parallel beta-helix repeat protein
VGENKETTIIDGDNKGSALRVMSPNVTISGFTIENGNNPLITDQTNPSQLSTLDYSALQTLTIQLPQTIGNTLTPSMSSGIYLSNADNCALIDNVVTNNTVGIVLASSANSTLKSNTLTDNKYGFGISATTTPTAAPPQYAQNIDSSNTINGKPIYYWISKNSLTVPSDAGYVALINCTNITVQNLELTNNYNGLLIADTESSIIRNITLTDDKPLAQRPLQHP